MDPSAVVVVVADPSQVGDARRRAIALADSTGFDETARGRIGICATELATNVLRHGGGGRLLMQSRTVGGGSVIDLIASDTGPGIANLGRAMQDGFSGGGTLGAGLGALERLADTFDVWTAPGRGMVVLARFRLVAPRPESLAPGPAWEWAAIELPAPGESVCGDAWWVEETPDVLSVLLVDGLGHGPEAAAAARVVAGVLRANRDAPPDRVLTEAHRAAQGGRGAAAGVARLPARGNRLAFAGVGNITGTVVSASGTRGMMSYGGIVGAQIRTIRSLDYDWPEDGLLVMHSDGLKSRWSLDDYPTLRARDPALIAAVLLRDFTRGRDDVSVAVARRRILR